MAVTTERRVYRRPLPYPHLPGHAPGSTVRAVGLGLITGAADDDPSAIGTYANAGSILGPAILWAAPAILPMRVVSVYLAAKLGQVTGQGLAAAIRTNYGASLLWTIVAAMVVGNVIEAAADLGGIGAAVHLMLPIPVLAIIVPVAAGILAAQVFGSYRWIRSIFRWLALALFAYVVSALLSRPNWGAVLKATIFPHIHWSGGAIETLVALIGVSISPYLYVWQASQEVEEDVSMGRRRLTDRKGTTPSALLATAWDVIIGMVFSTVVMYFIMLAAGTTLFPADVGTIGSAADAARALTPLAGHAAGFLFAAGIVGVGFLAVPVMTIGAAYMVAEAHGGRCGLSAKPREAKEFYAWIALFTGLAVVINLFQVNAMHMLVFAGVVQGLLAPALILIMLTLTCRASVMGPWTNSRPVIWIGGITIGLTATAAVAMLLSLA